MKINVEGVREKGRPKKIWLNTIWNGTRAVGVRGEDVENRKQWRFRTRVAVYKYLRERQKRIRSYY
jgi:hypothetical protein